MAQLSVALMAASAALLVMGGISAGTCSGGEDANDTCGVEDVSSALQVVRSKTRSTTVDGDTCKCGHVGATIEVFLRDWWGNSHAPFELTFHGAGCQYSVTSKQNWNPFDKDSIRFSFEFFPKCILHDPTHMQVKLLSECGYWKESMDNCLANDVWVQSVEVSSWFAPTKQFPYGGWASSLQALNILPLLSGPETRLAVQRTMRKAALVQLAVNRILYQWGNWAYMPLPLNIWSPNQTLIGFSQYLLSVVGYGWNEQDEAIVLPQEHVTTLALNLSTLVIPEVVLQALQVFAASEPPVLPLNEIMGQPKVFHEELVQLALGGLRSVGEILWEKSVSEFNQSMQDMWFAFTEKTGVKAVQKALLKFKELMLIGKPDKPTSSGELRYISPIQPGGVFFTLDAPGSHQKPSNFDNYVVTEQVWNEDWFLGQQMLQGVSPTMLTRVVGKLPSKLAVTDEVLGASDASGGLLGGLTIAQAIAAKLLFIVDCELLEGIKFFQGGKIAAVDEEEDKSADALEPRYASAAIGLFFLNATSESLLPIAVQLGQKPEDAPVYTPRDSVPEWTLAKMFFQCGVGNLHQINTHALRTHLVSEPWEVAIQRNLPTSHPVFKLVHPHMRYTLQINMMARSSLIAPGTVFDLFIATGASQEQWKTTPLYSNSSNASWSSVGYVDLFEKAYAQWDVDMGNFAKSIAKRGVEEEDLRIDYPYRDDGMLVWDALHSLVREMLELSYPDDAAVRSDPYLQSLGIEISYALANKVPGAEVKNGMPADAFSSVAKLADTITSALWGSGYQHSAVNYVQYDYFGYVPNMPLAMYKPVPKRGQGPQTMDDILEYLPSYGLAAQQIGVTYLLSTYYEDQVYLDQVNRTYGLLYGDKSEQAVLERYKQNLSKIESIVNERNGKRRVYYQQFLPSKTPISITV